MPFLLLIGCSEAVGPGNQGMVTSPEISTPQYETPPEETNPYSLWGFWWMHVDPASNTWEVVPTRLPQSHFNVRGLLEDGAPCTDCVKVTQIVPGPDGVADVYIELRHPLPQDSFTGFDLRAIAMWDGTEVWPESKLRTQNLAGPDGGVLNPDGYTTLFNPMQFAPGSDIALFTYSQGSFATPQWPDSTLNPYFEYRTDEERHMFRAGQAVTRKWEVQYPSSTFVMGYAICASWEPPVPDPPDSVPDDFSLKANQPEPYRVVFTQPAPLFPGVGSTATVEVEVWDWQDDSEEVWIECPALWTGIKYNDSLLTGEESVTYYVPIENETGLTDGKYKCLIGARDSTPIIYPWDYTTYIFASIEVGIPPPNQPPVAAAKADFYNVYTNEPVNFYSLATDPDGLDDIVEYLWDFENDGTWDMSETDPTWTYTAVGTYNVDHKVTDNGGLFDDLEPDEHLVINVTDPCCDTAPVAVIEGMEPHILTDQVITLTSSASYDPDDNPPLNPCPITVAWDTDNDGNYDDGNTTEIKVSWPATGIYQVSLQVTDSCGLLDIASTGNIEVHVGVTALEDQNYKNVGTCYRYVSRDCTPADVLLDGFDLSNPNTHWDFSSLSLMMDIGNHSAVLPDTHADVALFKDDFKLPYDYFYKTYLFSFMTWDEWYIAEQFVTSPDQLLWVGMHESKFVGSFSVNPPLEHPHPVWIFTDYEYSYGFPPIFELSGTMKGWGEGTVTVPYPGITNEPCVVIKSEQGILCDQYNLDVRGLLYGWYIDDGTLVAIAFAFNDADHTGYDPDTLEIIEASFNALSQVVPY